MIKTFCKDGKTFTKKQTFQKINMLKKIKPQTQYTITNSTNIETSSSSFSIVFYSLLLSVISNSANLRSCSSSLNSPFKSFSLSLKCSPMANYILISLFFSSSSTSPHYLILLLIIISIAPHLKRPIGQRLRKKTQTKPKQGKPKPELNPRSCSIVWIADWGLSKRRRKKKKKKNLKIIKKES